MIEYFIGMGISLVLVWMLWITWRVVKNTSTHDGTMEVLENHAEAIEAISQHVINPEEDGGAPMGFHIGK